MLTLHQQPDGTVVLTSYRGSRTHRYYLTPDDAQHISNRLQAFAKGQQSSYETIHPRYI